MSLDPRLVATLADQLTGPDGVDGAAVRALLAELLLRRGLSPDETLMLGPWGLEPDTRRRELYACHDALRGTLVAEVWHHPDDYGRWHGLVEDPPGVEEYAYSGDTREEVQAAVVAWLLEQGWHLLPGVG